MSALPVGKRCNSAFFKFLRVTDCSRRSPVNQISNGSRDCSSGSTLRSWQHFVGSSRYRMPNADSCVLDGLFRDHVYEVEVPIAGEFIAKFVGLLKVIAGFQEKHGNIRQAFS